MKMMKNGLTKRIIAMALSVVMIFGLLPVLGVTAVPVSNTAADPSSFNSWQEYFGTANISTEHAGGVWTDKSVFTSAGAQAQFGNKVTVGVDNFLIALSALGSNSIMVGQTSIPTDTMFVLDISGSMSSSEINAMVSAANDSIRTLLDQNAENRVGVVLYSDDAHVLLPLDSYNGVADDDGKLQYIQRGKEVTVSMGGGRPNRPGGNDGSYTYTDNSVIITVPGLTNGNGTAVSTEVELEGGTYIQGGLWAAWEEFDARTDATTIARTPAIVLMSDGAPTFVTNDFNNVPENYDYGSGNSSLDGDGFVTQLTAAWLKQAVAAKYGTTAYFYTLGLGVNNVTDSDVAIAVLDTSEAKQTDGIKNYWESYNNLTAGQSLSVTVGRRNSNNGTTVSVAYDADVIGKNAYVDKYFSAADASSLGTSFQSIVNEISLKAGYYPTRLDDNSPNYGGYITFVDELGIGMEVKQLEGILIGDSLYTGEAFAKALTDGSFGTKDAPTAMGDNLVWSVMERLNVDKDKAWELLNSAWNDGQLAHSDSGYSNYIGWYGDADGNFIAFWDKDDVTAPEGAVYKTKAYGMLGSTTTSQTSHASDMMYVAIRVSTEIATGNQLVSFRIPAALLPVVSYKITLNGSKDPETATSIELDYNSANPISLLYEVGVRSDITDYNIAEVLAKAAGNGAYTPNANGTYTLYTNHWYSDTTVGGNMNPSDDEIKDTAKNNFTYSYFEPGEENEHYYFTGISPVYDAQGNTVASTAQLTEGTTYYFRHRYFARTGNTTAAQVVYKMEQLSAEALAAATTEGQSYWYIPEGVMHHNTHSHDLQKDADGDGDYDDAANPTKTLHWVRKQIVDAALDGASHHYELTYLGNNGVLTYTPTAGIKLTKLMEDGSYPDTDFTFHIQLIGDNLAAEYPVVTRKLDGKESTAPVPVVDGIMTVKLKAGQTAFITGLPAGTRYSITEAENNTYQVASSSNASGVIIANTLSEVAFTNEAIVYSTLTVLKDVEYFKGAAVNTAAKFPVTVTFTHADGHAHDLPVVPTGVTKVSEGTYSFELTDGGSVVFSVPVGVAYTVVEGDLNTAESGFSFDANRSIALTGTVTLAGSTAVIVNNYNPDDLVVDENNPPIITFEIDKTLSGRDWTAEDKFQFQLQIYNTATHEWGNVDGFETITINGTSNVVTGSNGTTKTTATMTLNYTFKSVGNYFFRITEIVPNTEDQQVGMTYDRSRFDFEVEIADNQAGELVLAEVREVLNAKVSETSEDVWHIDASFTNTYVDGSTKLTFNPIKHLTNVTDPANPAKMDLRDGQFQFTMYTTGADFNITNAIKEERYNGANGDIVFGTLTYTQAGYNYYVIKETHPNGNGITVDTTEYKIVVFVEKDASNALYISSITVNGASVAVPANGVLTDVPGVFDFGFNNDYAATPATDVVISGNKTLTGRPKALKPNEFSFTMIGSGVNETVYNNADGSFSFPAMSYNTVGTHTYLIKENIPDEAVNGVYKGVKYDTAEYTVVVTVSDNGKGQLVATYTVNGLHNLPIAFHNSYSAAPDTIVLGGVKDLDGIRALKAGEFTFQLKYGDRVVQTVTNAADGSFRFAPLNATQVGSNTFTIVEVKEDLGGVTYDETVHTVKVTVTDDSEGNLTATADKTHAEVRFVNKYNAEPVKVALGGVKILTGAALKPGTFNFKLTGEGQNMTATNGEHGVFTFEEIEYTAPGVHTYTIEEIIPDEAVNGVYKGVTYDTVTYQVTVTVKDNEVGQLVAEVSSVDNNGVAAEVQFFNIYNAESVNVSLNTGKKTLNGRDLKDGEFAFVLFDEAGNAVETVKNAADGAIAFSDLTFDKVGTYVYTVKEDNSATVDGMAYDGTVYTITVEVTDDGEGNLEAKVTYLKDGKDYDGNLDFVNTFTPAAVDVEVIIEKILTDVDQTGRGLAGFIFEVLNTYDNTYEQFTSDDTGLIKLNFNFTQADIGKTYEYAIYEVDTEIVGMTYDETIYALKITVSQDAETGELIVEATVDENAITGNLQFVNIYEEDLPPDTGDDFNMVGMVTAMLLSMMCLVAVLVMNKKNLF